MFSGKKLLIFGGGFLQLSLIERCKKLGIVSVVIDPNGEAEAKDSCDHFEIVGGQDFDATCRIVDKYGIDGILTSATDKPLVMMARIAAHFQLPFYSIETAKNCTNKHLMKSIFQKNDIPCAEGYLISDVDDILSYPVIIKPVDNSGSRGVFYCQTEKKAQQLLEEAFKHTKSEQLLAERFISGPEFSVESLHYNGECEILQVTQKITTPFPANVEIGQIAPAPINDRDLKQIESVVLEIARAFAFENCAAHTELKIEDGKIIVIETSPRLGGDFITSDLVPKTSGVNMEDALIAISLGKIPIIEPKQTGYSGAFFLTLPQGKRIKKLPDPEYFQSLSSVDKFTFLIDEGDVIGAVNSSLDRHGYFILSTQSREALIRDRDRIFREVYSNIVYH